MCPLLATTTNRLLFLLRLFTVLMKKTRAVKQSIILDVYDFDRLAILNVNKNDVSQGAS